MRLYVGNLPYRVSEGDVENWFNQAGFTVDNINLMRDRMSGEARGFGFVEIENAQDAERAIAACNGKDFLGRAVVVNEARPMGQGGERGAPRTGQGGGGQKRFGAAGGGGRPRY